MLRCTQKDKSDRMNKHIVLHHYNTVLGHQSISLLILHLKKQNMNISIIEAVLRPV